MSLIVDIPYEIEISYTSYVKGAYISEPILASDNSYLHFHLLDGTIFVLFYYFDKDDNKSVYRRCYILKTSTEAETLLPGISEPVEILYSARGQKFDYLDQIIKYMMKKSETECFKFPDEFWYRLASLIEITNPNGKKKDGVSEKFRFSMFKPLIDYLYSLYIRR